MNSLSLTACSFWLRGKYTKKTNSSEIIGLNKEITNEENSYMDFMDLLDKFAEEYKNFMSNDDIKKMFRINPDNIIINENEKLRYAYFDINSGNYGIESNIINTKTNKVLYKRQKDNAEIINFRVLFAIPKGEGVYKGIIIFQNIGPYGIKTITTNYLKSFISDKLNIICHTGNICPQVFIKKMLDNDGIKKIIYIRNNISNDNADVDDMGYGKEERIITGLYNKKKWGEMIFSYLNGKGHIYEFEDIEYSKLKMVTSVYGRERTININNIDNLSIIEGIPDNIINEIGDVDNEKLMEHFINVTNEYIENMVYKN